MSVFVPPLSVRPFERFLVTKPVDSGYDTFAANAPSTVPDKSIKKEITVQLIALKELAEDIKKNPGLIPGGLRDPGNYIGFRMAGRIAEKLEIGPLSEPPLKIELRDEKYKFVKLVWEDDIDQEPTEINIDKARKFEKEILGQASEGDFFIIRHFLNAHGGNALKVPFLQNSLVWQLFSIWNALQLPLAQIVFNAKSRNFGIKRPYERDPKKYPLFPSSLPLPLHTSYPSGHAAGAGALAGLIYWLLTAAEKANAAEEYIPIAYRVGLLREFAGLHWTQDTAKGFLVGLRFAHGVLKIALNRRRYADLAWLLGQCVSKIK